MPELPEVETTRRGLEPVMKGKRISAVIVNRRDLRMPLPRGFEKHVAGQQIIGLRRRAKYLLIDLKNGQSILVHLGMSGSMRVETKNAYQPLTHDHVIFQVGERYIIFHDPRRFGLVLLLETHKEAKHKLLAHLGPEPLDKTFNATYLKGALAGRKGPIKTTIMDQTIVVGVGNIYASESLFLAKIHPQTPAHEAAKHAATLVKTIQKTLNAALKSGGSTLRDYKQANGETGYFQHRFNVYERRSHPCVACDDTVHHITQAGRASYFCPTCQPNKNTLKKPRISKA
jgi:formamidopyrimidine-DNA glycosylase